MLENYKIANDLFYAEVCQEIEAKYPIVGKLDIPMYVYIEYDHSQEQWNCTCRLEPMTGKRINIHRQYSSEIIGAYKELGIC